MDTDMSNHQPPTTNHQPSVLVCIPAYDAKLSVETALGLANCRDLYTGIVCVTNCCHVALARNRLARHFLDSKMDKMVFIDTDIGFKRGDFERLISSDVPIVGGVYRLRQEKQDLALVALPDKPLPDEPGVHEVARVATGFMAITRLALLTMVNLSEQVVPFGPAGDTCWDFFPQGVRESQYVSEDYCFCDLAREVGVKVYADTRIVLGHVSKRLYEVA